MSLVAKPTALLQQLETFLNQPRLTKFKNVVFVLVLIHYWSRLYSKVIVAGPTRAAKDGYAYCAKVGPIDYTWPIACYFLCIN